MKGHVEVVRELLARGAHAELKDKDGFNALIGGKIIFYSFHCKRN